MPKNSKDSEVDKFNIIAHQGPQYKLNFYSPELCDTNKYMLNFLDHKSLTAMSQVSKISQMDTESTIIFKRAPHIQATQINKILVARIADPIFREFNPAIINRLQATFSVFHPQYDYKTQLLIRLYLLRLSCEKNLHATHPELFQLQVTKFVIATTDNMFLQAAYLQMKIWLRQDKIFTNLRINFALDTRPHYIPNETFTLEELTKLLPNHARLEQQDIQYVENFFRQIEPINVQQLTALRKFSEILLPSDKSDATILNAVKSYFHNPINEYGVNHYDHAFTNFIETLSDNLKRQLIVKCWREAWKALNNEFGIYFLNILCKFTPTALQVKFATNLISNMDYILYRHYATRYFRNDIPLVVSSIFKNALCHITQTQEIILPYLARLLSNPDLFPAVAMNGIVEQYEFEQCLFEIFSALEKHSDHYAALERLVNPETPTPLTLRAKISFEKVYAKKNLDSYLTFLLSHLNEAPYIEEEFKKNVCHATGQQIEVFLTSTPNVSAMAIFLRYILPTHKEKLIAVCVKNTDLKNIIFNYMQEKLNFINDNADHDIWLIDVAALQECFDLIDANHAAQLRRTLFTHVDLEAHDGEKKSTINYLLASQANSQSFSEKSDFLISLLVTNESADLPEGFDRDIDKLSTLMELLSKHLTADEAVRLINNIEWISHKLFFHQQIFVLIAVKYLLKLIPELTVKSVLALGMFDWAHKIYELQLSKDDAEIYGLTYLIEEMGRLFDLFLPDQIEKRAEKIFDLFKRNPGFMLYSNIRKLPNIELEKYFVDAFAVILDALSYTDNYAYDLTLFADLFSDVLLLSHKFAIVNKMRDSYFNLQPSILKLLIEMPHFAKTETFQFIKCLQEDGLSQAVLTEICQLSDLAAENQPALQSMKP